MERLLETLEHAVAVFFALVTRVDQGLHLSQFVRTLGAGPFELVDQFHRRLLTQIKYVSRGVGDVCTIVEYTCLAGGDAGTTGKA